jgi:invasion protein IalB
MTDRALRAGGWRGIAVCAGLAAAAVFACLGSAGAQQAKDQKGQKQQAPAQKGGQTGSNQQQGAQSAWVKLCEKVPLVHRGADGKEAKEERGICLTHHERLDGNTGMVLVSAAIRKIDGNDKQHLMIMVPLGMAIPPGLKAAVYNKDQWAKAQKNEKVDDKQLKPVDLKYALCHREGCTAEVEATNELVESMKTGGGLMVLALNANAQPIAFPVPLEGFAVAHAGPAVDNKTYAEARGQLMEQIRARQIELFKQYQQEQQKNGAAQGQGGTPQAQKQGAPPAQKK